MAKWIASAMVAVGMLASSGASAAASVPSGMTCAVVETWACPEGKACGVRGGDVGASYGFDLVAMTYQAPNDRGPITELETDDRGFITFVLGGGRRYVHKNAGEGDPITSFLYLSPHDMRQLRCSTRYSSIGPNADAERRRGLAGHYYLSGVMETGSELLLRPDGSFAWFMSYGSVDQEAAGKWHVDGGSVLLDSRPAGSTEPAFRQLRLRIDRGALLLKGAANGRYERHP